MSSVYYPTSSIQNQFIHWVNSTGQPVPATNVPTIFTNRNIGTMATSSPTNIIIYQDAQDMYCNTVGHIKLQRGTNCKIELPNGEILYVDNDGNLATKDFPYNVVKHNQRDLQIKEGRECKIELPDGSFIIVDAQGNYHVNDSNAEVVYKANRIRDFNRFINASDILENFIDFVGGLGISQSELMKLPIELFINFLIIKAAEADGDMTPDLALEHHPALLPAPRKRYDAHCRCCGKFVTKNKHEKGVDFCSHDHFMIYTKRNAIFGESLNV